MAAVSRAAVALLGALVAVAGLSDVELLMHYIVQQKVQPDGSTASYVPYTLWNEDVYANSSSLAKNPAVEIRSANGILDVVLQVTTCTVTTELFSYTTRAFAFQGVCSVPAPTIVVKPGDKLRITIENTLEATEDTTGVFPNRSNFYIFGLRTDLDPAVNNPFRYTSGGGDTLLYEYTLPYDTPTGHSWYMSRVAGHASLSVLGGLSGAFVVEAGDLDTVSVPVELEKMTKQLLVLSHTMVQKSSRAIEASASGAWDAVDSNFLSDSLSLQYLSEYYGSQLPLEVTYGAPRHFDVPISDAWLTNGQYQPSHTIQPGEWVLYDMIALSPDRQLEVALKTAVGFEKGVDACDVRLVSQDGAWLAAPRSNATSRRIAMVPGARAAITVQCNTSGTYYLQSVASFDATDTYFGMGDFSSKSIQNLLTIQVTGDTVDYMFPLSSLSDPYYSSSAAWTGDEEANATAAAWSVASAPYVTSDALCDLTSSSSSNSSNGAWLGVGVNCQLPCYSDVLCGALYGSGDGDVHVSSFPTVANGDCAFASVTAACGSPSSLSPRVSHTAALGSAQTITVFAHEDALQPFFIQGAQLLLQAFENVDEDISNIVSRGGFVASTLTDAQVTFLIGYRYCYCYWL
jgi:FtsP/CotA-like multicopper oxidase with cupredoxin domain